MKYVVIGSTLSGNKGAASMLEAAVQTITENDINAEFVVFSVYPEEDTKLNKYSNVSVQNAKPFYLALVVNTLAIAYRFLPFMRSLISRNSAIKALSDADVLLDQGGITFVDGREKFLIYNVATLIPAIAMKVPIIKCAQAMGPFSGINRLVAKLILPRLKLINARGDVTRVYLDSLNLSNVRNSADGAFLLHVSNQARQEAEDIYKQFLDSDSSVNKEWVGVLPSEVVRKKADKIGSDYIKYNTDFIKHLLSEGYGVVLLAYSARKNTESLHNNDLPVCRQVYRSVGDTELVFVDRELTAQELKHLISILDFVVVSRFHAMVAALSVATPTVVIGWSHKYKEVMRMFGLEQLTLSSSDMDVDKLKDSFSDTYKNRKVVKKKIESNLQIVKESAASQFKF